MKPGYQNRRGMWFQLQETTSVASAPLNPTLKMFFMVQLEKGPSSFGTLHKMLPSQPGMHFVFDLQRISYSIKLVKSAGYNWSSNYLSLLLQVVF